jgi:membrane fusion protein (multidrug efflux system)
VPGFLGPRLIKEGDDIREGQVVFTIEREPFEAVVDQRKAQLAAARATLTNADQQLQRTTELARKGKAPVAQLDQRTAEQGQAKAAIMEAEANLRDAQIRLSYTEIKTPISGRIERAAVSPGNLVGPDSGVLATVVQDNPMQVLFSVTQLEMLEAKDSEVTGKVRARVRLANGSLYSEKGRIDFLDVQVNPRTDGQTVRAMFPNPEDILTQRPDRARRHRREGRRPGRHDPPIGRRHRPDRPYVFIVGQDDKVEQHRVGEFVVGC